MNLKPTGTNAVTIESSGIPLAGGGPNYGAWTSWASCTNSVAVCGNGDKGYRTRTCTGSDCTETSQTTTLGEEHGFRRISVFSHFLSIFIKSGKHNFCNLCACLKVRTIDSLFFLLQPSVQLLFDLKN